MTLDLVLRTALRKYSAAALAVIQAVLVGSTSMTTLDIHKMGEWAELGILNCLLFRRCAAALCSARVV